MSVRQHIIRKYPNDRDQQIVHLTSAVEYALKEMYATSDRDKAGSVFLKAVKGGSSIIGKAYIRDIDQDRTLARLYEYLAKAILSGDNYNGDNEEENERFSRLIQEFIEKEEM